MQSLARASFAPRSLAPARAARRTVSVRASGRRATHGCDHASVNPTAGATPAGPIPPLPCHLTSALPAAAGAINPDIKKDVEKVVDSVVVPADLGGKPQVLRCGRQGRELGQLSIRSS